MVDALANMQPMPRGDAGSLLGQFENLKRGFVGSGLLSGDHVIEGHGEPKGSCSKKVVVDIGNDRELIT